MKIPAHRNIVDLKYAWVIRWKNAILIEFKEIANIIRAIWLKVDKAMIFFMSCSQFAEILANIVVSDEIVIIRVIQYEFGKFNNRISKNTPAVTSVDEWTKAEIGVGAAIAAGSQAENGNWALFVNAAVVKRIKVIKGKFWFIVKFQLFEEISIAIDKIIKMSPTRLDRIVIHPDPDELGFW